MFAEGGCSCGAVRYRLQRRPMIVHACHCTDCQRLSGCAYATNAWIEDELVELTAGSPQRHVRKTSSGNDHTLVFCGRCGVTLWTRYHRPPGLCWWVRVGTLDDPKLLSPEVHIFTRSKHPAVVLPPSVPVFEVYYDHAAVWPPESMQRYSVNIAAHPKAT